MRARIAVPLLAVASALTACEDQGNPGNDNLLTGGSLVIIVVIIAVVGYLIVRSRR